MVKKNKTGTALNVLSLEDSAEDFEIICKQLTNAGYNLNISRVEKEMDFASALRNNKYDIILADFQLPGFDGFGALHLRNEICTDVPFICVSGSIGEETAIDLIKQGAVDYVLKDRLARLPSVVKRALDEAKEKKTRQQAEERERLANDVLDRLNYPYSTTDTIRDILQMVKKSTGIEAVGIRLREGDDFPYYETNGFPDHFVQMERYLCARDEGGQIVCDKQGNPVLECMCGNIICGRTNPAFPFFTKGGSFWSNCTTDLLASTTEKDRQAHTRNRCNGEGYESVALIPLRVGEDVIGLLQFDDHRQNQFTPEMIRFFEGLSASIGIALSRKQAEEALRVKEERYRELFNNISSGVAIYEVRDNGEDFIFADFNKAGETIDGDRREDLIGKSIYDARPAIIEYGLLDVFKRVWKTGTAEYFPPKLYQDTRINKWYENFVYRLPTGEIVSLYNDVTERKKAEDELKFRNLLLLTQQETSLDGIIVLDESGNIISCNKRFLNIWELSSEKIKTMSGKDVLRSNMQLLIDKDQYSDKVLYLSTHTKETSNDEINFLDGRCYERYSAPMIGSDNKYYGRVWYFHDITNRKRTEEELKKYREHLEEVVKERTNDLARERNLLWTLIDSLPDEIYAKDMDSRFIIANSHVLSSFGRTNINEIIGKTDFEILPQNEAIKYYSAEHMVLYAKGQMLNYEVCIQDAAGNPRWYSITKVPMRDKEGNITGLVGINRDITYRKETDERLEKAKEAAETANLAKSTFLSNMSHEIRTPLNAILGFSELMQSDKDLSLEHINWLKTINRSGEHLLALINDILEISRIEAGRISFNPASFDIHSLLRDIEAMFRVKTDQKNLSLLFEYSDELPRYIVTDEGKLRQIIINLVGNAVKFTKEGGVAFRARVKHENDKIHFIAEVDDTGPGVAQKDIDKLFQKFGQTEAGIKEGGTGLGLVISQQYAKIMGGEIILRSKEGKGTCFTLTIEFENSEILIKKENHKRKVIGLKPGQKQYRILVADDRADNRELLKIMLTSIGFDVEEAQNGNETIEKFKIWSPDLILMDMRMPVIDGYEATRRIKAMENVKIRIIAVTASAFQEDTQKSLEAGADAYLRKPFKEHELFECIESCLGVQYVYEGH